MKALIQPKDAEARIQAHLPQVPTISCPLNKCAGRILQEPILADRPLPPFDRSMMDGYAIRTTALKSGNTLRVTNQLSAGCPALSILGAPEDCIEIMTGAVVPPDADAVIPYEDTERLADGMIRVTQPEQVDVGDFIHKMGSDHSSGSALLQPGTRIGSREIAIAATCGYTLLKVSKIPSIAIVSTGDELVPVDQTPEPHQIRRSNDIAIETALAQVPLHAETQVHLPDDATAAKAGLRELIEANTFLIISGGISMGQKDYIPQVLTELGLTCHFHGVAQKPGKPFGFWANQHCAVFALPGNPISTLTCLHRYVIPAILRASGMDCTQASLREVSLSENCQTRDDLTLFLPVSLSPDNQATPRPIQNSGDLVTILQSDGFVELAPNALRQSAAGSRHHYYGWR